MNYTREPLIETVITPKEGYKLIIRNSKGSGHEEYAVDAIEVVSFGNSFFFRSLERPKSFLVPVSDYEVIETKETRVVLKNASFERAIKIGGGREPSPKKEKPAEEPAAVEQKLEKKRERRRHRRRRSTTDIREEESKQPVEEKTIEGGGADDEVKTSSSILTRFIPPPTELISARFKDKKSEATPETEGDVLPEPVKEEKSKGRRKKKVSEKEDPAPKDEEVPRSDTESGEVQRVAAEPAETVTSTSFSTVEEKSKSSFFGKIW